MALSFLYLAFTRILQLVCLSQRDRDELAIEVVMLRHGLVVLRWHVDRHVLRPMNRAFLAALSGTLLGVDLVGAKNLIHVTRPSDLDG